jgi:hypothetical protein
MHSAHATLAYAAAAGLAHGHTEMNPQLLALLTGARLIEVCYKAVNRISRIGDQS